MTGELQAFSEGLAGTFRVCAGLLLLPGLLGAEKPEKREMAAGGAGGALLSAAASLAGIPDMYVRAAEAVLLVLCGARAQKKERRMFLFLSIYYEIAVSLWSFLAAALLGVCFRSGAFLDRRTPEGQAAVWCFYLLAALLAGILVRFSAAKKERAEREEKKKNGIRGASLIAVAGFLITVTLSGQNILLFPGDELDVWIILSLILLVAVMAFSMNRQYEAERELAELKEEQARLLERDYTALNRAYSVNARLFHDLHNHIGALRQLLTHEKYEEALQYLDGLQAPVREMTDSVWTGDETVDYLINSKAAAAADRQIAFEAEAEFPRRTGIHSSDLCAVLGNLLDNALEAAGKAEEPGRRWVRLTIRRIHQMLVIKVENGFQDRPVEKNGTFITTKTEKGLHGWGLKSARLAAEKYEGTVSIFCGQDVFRATATFSCRMKS